MKSLEISEGPIMIMLLSCLAVALCFLSFGLGMINLTGSQAAAQPAPPPPPVAAPVPPPPPPEDHESRAQAAQKKLELQRLNSELERQRQELERLQRELEQQKANLKKARQQLAALLAQAQSLAQQVAERTGRLAGEQQQTTQAQAELDRRITEARRQLQEAERKIEELKKKIDDRKFVDPLRIFGGSGSVKNPQWIECVRDAVVLQPQGERITVEQLKNKSSSFTQTARRSYLVFLIRPQGFDSFEQARELAQSQGAKFGFEPVDDNWALRYR